MQPDRIIVCGGRDFERGDWVNGVLDMHAEDHVIDAIIQGDCPTGADRLARRWAIANNHHLETFPADWRAHGKAAGPIRNQQMIDEGRPTMVFAFPGGRGTADMIRRAERAGIPVHRFTPTTQETT